MERTRERLRVAACHESAHAAVAFVLGRSFKVVSIRSTQGYGGLVILGKRPPTPQAAIGTPTILLPAALRRAAEVECSIALAGAEGTALAYEGVSGRRLEGDPAEEIYARSLSASIAGLSASEERRLVDAERDPGPVESDAEAAWRLAQDLAGDTSEAAAHLEWVRRFTAGLVRSERGRRLIAALVPVLLKHEVVSGRAARQIFAEAEPGWLRPIQMAASPPDPEGGDMASRTKTKLGPDTPLGELLYVTDSLSHPTLGAVRATTVIHRDDPRAKLGDQFFQPLIDRIG